MRTSFLAFLTFVGFISCNDDPISDDLEQLQEAEIQAFIVENSLDATKDDAGYYYVVLQDNELGQSQDNGKILSIYYSMSILGGDEISFHQPENGDPIKLRQGLGTVVPVGLDLGIALMKEGESYQFILPSALAFEDLQFSTLIPANSIISVEVDLVAVENEDNIFATEVGLIDSFVVNKNLNDTIANPVDEVQVLSSGLRYKRQVRGATGVTPQNGDMVEISYRGTFLNGEQFDATTGNDTFEFAFGTREVILGLDEAVSLMEVGEQALFLMPSEIAYGPSVRVIPDFLTDQMIERLVIPDYAGKVTPFEPLAFEITLR
ncbi:MAG: FKBP-type peptidyl-prolyl cis-trans isomerase [Cyclobacteriaceae bacterium]